MINFLIGLAIGGIIAIFVYRNNEEKLNEYAEEVDELYERLNKK